MAGLSTGDQIVVVETRDGSTHADTFRDSLNLVLETLNSGRIADGEWGSKEHIEALDLVAVRCRHITREIVKWRDKIEQSDRD